METSPARNFTLPQSSRALRQSATLKARVSDNILCHTLCMDELTCPYCNAVFEDARALMEHFCPDKPEENS